LIINPGSQQVLETAGRDGLLNDLTAIGGVVMANACGPCIGQWNRKTDNPTRPNSLVMTFNRNFAKRTDGNPNSYVFIASPELTIAFTLAGDLCFNPLTDKLVNREGKAVMLDPPAADALPVKGMTVSDNGYIAPVADGSNINVVVRPDSKRLQLLKPFEPWDGNDFENMPLLIKTQGKTTTDHISMAGPWLKYRGHLENISDNLLMGATNAFNGETNKVLNQLDDTYDTVSTVAKAYKAQGIDSIIVGADNYGEGSSREHAALEPRFLGVKVVLVKSFARIHETNLKKQGMLALTFADKNDYDRIRESDRISVTGLADFAPEHPLAVTLYHADGATETIEATHTYNAQQIKWFRAGSALNQN
ncbi:MAG: aconitate hydratase, partial [Tannerella sp.]|nr:aconitate hydratase [Tannerella sp.]